MKLLNIDFKNEISTEDLSFFLVQWYSGQCLTTSSLKKKAQIHIVCRILWYKFCHHGLFQTTEEMSLKPRFGGSWKDMQAVHSLKQMLAAPALHCLNVFICLFPSNSTPNSDFCYCLPKTI